MNKTAKTVLLLVVASVIMVGVVLWVGVDKTIQAVAEAGVPAFLAVGICQFLIVLCQAGGWAVLSRPLGQRVPFPLLLEANVVGQAVNIITPSAYLGGEPAKVYWVGRRTDIPYHSVAGTVVLAKYLEALAFFLVFALLTGLAAFTFRETLFASPYLPLGISLVTFAAFLVVVCAVLWISLVRRLYPLTRILSIVNRLRPRSAFLLRLRRKTRSMEDQINHVFSEEGRYAVGAFLVAMVLEAVMFVRPLFFFWIGAKIHLTVGALALIFVAGQALLAIQITPSGIGTFDGGLLAAMSLVGVAAPQCMAYLLAMRLWDAVTVGAAMMLGARRGLAWRSDPATPDSARAS